MSHAFIAHLRNHDKQPQGLWTHLEEVAALSGQYAEKIGLKQAGELIGLVHDFGKASQKFDKYIRSAVGLIDPDEDGYVDASGMKVESIILLRGLR